MRIRADRGEAGGEGLLFWAGEADMSPSSDYLALGIRAGHVTLGWNLGSGEVVITYNETRVNDGRWHKIRAQRCVCCRNVNGSSGTCR